MSSLDFDLPPELDVKVESNGGWITLNRPQALNALSLAMIRGLRKILSAWQVDPNIDYVECRFYCIA